MNPWIWAIGAVLIAILELHAPGYYLIWLAGGAALTAILSSVFQLSFSAQLATFTIASGLSCIAGFFVYRRLGLFKKMQTSVNQRATNMVGARGTICVALSNGQGKVRLGDSVWLAEGPDLEIGTPVEVKGVRNTVVIVQSLAGT